MAEEEKKKKKRQSKFMLRVAVLVLFCITVVQSYIILKSRKYIKRATGETNIVDFAEKEFERDRENAEDLFERFMRDTDYKGKPITKINKEDVAKEIAPIKEKFDEWYVKKFGDERISHSTALKGGRLVLTIYIPGIKKETVDITVRDEIIKMSGNLSDGKKITHSIMVPKRAAGKSPRVDFNVGPDRINIIFGA